MEIFPHHLRCSECDWISTPESLRNLCPHCSSPLLVSWDLQPSPVLLEKIRRRPASMWRFREVLPGTAAQQPVSLGEGATPLLHAHRLGRSLNLSRLFVKDESRNPTRSFKARGMSAAVTMAKNLGASVLAAPTAGNAGAALAAYSARAGLECRIAMPGDTPRSIVRECHSYGASVTEVEGVITDAGRLVREWVEHDAVFDVSTLKEPYRVEGKKTMGYELLLDLDGRLPDVIVYPTGGGTGLIGMWKAFDEMQRLGWIDHHRPRMMAVQSSGCAPIVRAWEEGLDHAPEWPEPETCAWGLRVPRAVGDRLMLRAIRESGGAAVAVEEADLEDAANRLRRAEGIDAGPESGAALLAVEQLVRAGALGNHEVVVLFNTGANKYGP
jgi:threonine synthase